MLKLDLEKAKEPKFKLPKTKKDKCHVISLIYGIRKNELIEAVFNGGLQGLGNEASREILV